MSNFKIEINGLAILKDWLKETQNANAVIPDVTMEVLKFHNVLERRVNAVFSAKPDLSSVLIGRSVRPENIGNTLLRFSLQYQDKALALSQFAHTIEPSSSISSAPLRFNGLLGFVKWTPGEWSKQVAVSVQRSKVKYGVPNKQSAYEVNGQLRTRAGEATWTVYPTKGSKGTRAPTVALWGPSLAAQAKGIFNNDAATKLAFDKMGNNIMDIFTRYYTNAK